MKSEINSLLIDDSAAAISTCILLSIKTSVGCSGDALFDFFFIWVIVLLLLIKIVGMNST